MLPKYYREVFKRTWKGKLWEAWRLAGVAAAIYAVFALAFNLPLKSFLPILVAPVFFMLKLCRVAEEMDAEKSAEINRLNSAFSEVTRRTLRVAQLGVKEDGAYYLEIENLSKTRGQNFNASILEVLDGQGRTIAEEWPLRTSNGSGGLLWVPAGRSVKVLLGYKSGDIVVLSGATNSIPLAATSYVIGVLIDNAEVPLELTLLCNGEGLYLAEGENNPAMGPI